MPGDAGKAVMVLGGYGAVGRTVCEELASIYEGPIRVAGRNFQKAQQLAQRLRGAVEPVQVDVTDPNSWGESLQGVAVVINCVESHNLSVARQCLAQSVHYVDISATASILQQLQGLQSEAQAGNVTVVLSVGVAPGLTNLLTAYAQSRLGPLTQADLSVLLGFGEVHGEAAIRWTLKNLGKPFSVPAGNVSQEVRSFIGARSTKLPPPFGRRSTFRFDFSDQHTLPESLGIETVNTWLCFDSRLATRLFWLLALLRVPSVIPLWRYSGKVKALSERVSLGGTRFVVQVDAINQQGELGRFALMGDGEARMTGLVAAHVAKQLLSGSAPSGVLHIEQLLSLETLLPALVSRLWLLE